MAVTPARAVLDQLVPEGDLQDAVVDLARLLGWSVYHTHDSRRSEAGWPDLALVRGGDRPRLLFAELKSQNGHLSPKQAAWLARLQAVAAYVAGHAGEDHACVQVVVWRPSDWSSGKIEAMLR